MSKLLEISLTDGLGFDSGFVSHASYTCMIYIMAPDDWMPEQKQEEILQKMYGQNWREGNGDGSFFVVTGINWQEQNLTQKPWEKYKDDTNFRCWFWKVEDNVLKDTEANKMV